MKILSVFNNKGGVGKTTLINHLAHALAEMGNNVLMIDLDPQSNLTIQVMEIEKIHEIWKKEDDFIERGFDSSKEELTKSEFNILNSSPRTIHYLLKPTEEGTGDLDVLSPPVEVKDNLSIIPGRLTLHKYEDRISSRWSHIYQGDPLAIRTITKIRSLASDYAKEYNYDYVIVDTSPNLGSLNKVIISTVDGFVIPALPDMFSLYGIRNIGDSLTQWKREFDTIYSLISGDKRRKFPSSFVKFLGFTIYNAKKYKDATEWDLAQAHYNYAKKIPDTISKYIKPEVRDHLDEDMLSKPIGLKSVMHTHNTLPSMAQKYKCPIWEVPNINDLEKMDINTVRGNKRLYENKKEDYINFAKDLLKRVACLD